MKVIDLMYLNIGTSLAIVRAKSKKNGKVLPVVVSIEDIISCYFKCSICGSLRSISEVVTYKSTPICQECKDTRFVICEDCGDLIPKRDAIILNGRQLCSNCTSHYKQCSSCGVWFKIVDMETVGMNDGLYTHVCNDCLQKGISGGSIGQCSICGEYFYKFYLSTIGEELYCDECITNKLIPAYHCSRPPLFYSLNSKKEAPLRKNLYLGIEVEMSCVGSGNGALAKKILELGYLKCEHDSSIYNGFEVISDAMTLPFWQKNSGGFSSLSKAIEAAKEEGFREHPSSGIHVHFNNGLLTYDQLVNIGVFIMTHYCDCIRFGRRNPDELKYCEYCDHLEILTTTCTGHDWAINYDNPKHTELRFFATSTDKEHIKAILEFTYALCKTAMGKNSTFNWSDIKKTAKESGICPHFLRELNNNFESAEIENYDYTHIAGRTL